ncbi:NADH:ubiquinone oxidoreductase 6.6kD subunit [Nemania diffusa]|nr:NADH:ubiquinone oxidoreductase 6.6kD subunit [Nemania diffusa]
MNERRLANPVITGMANDPAILKMGTMSTNRYKYFRWTKRSARLTIVYGLVMPSLFAFVAYKTDGKFDFRGKTRGDLIYEY